MSIVNISYKAFQDFKANNTEEACDYNTFVSEELQKIKSPKELMDSMILSFGRCFEKAEHSYINYDKNFRVIDTIFDYLYYQDWAEDVIHFVKSYIGPEYLIYHPFVFSNLKNSSTNMSLSLGCSDDIRKAQGMDVKEDRKENIFLNLRSNIMGAYQKAVIAFCNRDNSFFDRFKLGEGSNLNYINYSQGQGEDSAWQDKCEMQFIVKKEFDGSIASSHDGKIVNGKMTLTACVSFNFSWPHGSKYHSKRVFETNVKICNCIKSCKVDLMVDTKILNDKGYSDNIFTISYDPSRSGSESELKGLTLLGFEEKTWLRSVNALLHLLQRPSPHSMLTCTDTDFLVLSTFRNNNRTLKICVDNDKIFKDWKENSRILKESIKSYKTNSSEEMKDKIRYCVRNQEIMAELIYPGILKRDDNFIKDYFYNLDLEPPDLERVDRSS